MVLGIEKVQGPTNSISNRTSIAFKKSQSNDNLPELIANTSATNNVKTDITEESFLEKHKLGLTLGCVALGILICIIGKNPQKAAKFFEQIKNKVKVLGTPAKVSKTATSTPIKATGAKILSLEEKISHIKGKFGFTEEEIKNPILRENIEKIYEYMSNDSYRSIFRMMQDKLKTMKFTFSKDAFKYVDLSNVPKSTIGRAMHKNYPMEIIEQFLQALDQR